MTTTETNVASQVRLDYMSSFTGDKSIVIEGDDPEKRAELATHVKELLRLGYAVILQEEGTAFRIKDYDAQSNEWVVTRDRRKSAAGSRANVIPPRSGG